jgi:hypothetical protein
MAALKKTPKLPGYCFFARGRGLSDCQTTAPQATTVTAIETPNSTNGMSTNSVFTPILCHIVTELQPICHTIVTFANLNRLPASTGIAGFRGQPDAMALKPLPF